MDETTGAVEAGSDAVANNAAASASSTSEALRAALRYIDEHLEQGLSPDVVAEASGWRGRAFDRLFAEALGIELQDYVELNRLKRVSFYMAYRGQVDPADVVAESGYAGLEALSQAFERRFGQSPIEFRRQPQWERWHAVYEPLVRIRLAYTTQDRQVRIEKFEATQVAVMEHRGDLRFIGDTLRKFIAWRKDVGLPPTLHATFNVIHDDPAPPSPWYRRVDLCVATDRTFGSSFPEIAGKVIPEGRCAVLRHHGSEDTLVDSIRFLRERWLPDSAEDPREHPIFFKRLTYFPDIPEREAALDLYLPLR